ncbi:MAG: hypothetical protein IJI35_03005 [Kiritimatiellae bacterium]|nr:hypothetical protein [Kiritimatiellia bacterium]
MKAPVHALAIIASLCAFGEETTAPAEAAAASDTAAATVETPAAAPAPAETKPAEAPAEAPVAPAKEPSGEKSALPNAAASRDSTDEIDLDEADDSAEARAKAPTISATTSSNNVTLVDIACDNATLEDVLRQFRKVTDANIISDDSTNLQRRVSVNLHRVNWLDGLQSILNSRNYRLEERGDIYFVREDKVLEPVLTRSFTLNHASASELADLFNKSYGKKDAKGNVIVPIASSFDGANVVVVNATEKTLVDCESIIKAVDKAIAQIYIEARFLELSSEAMHKLGVMWNQLESWGVTAKGLQAGWENNYGRVAKYGTTKEKTMYTPKEWYKETDKEGLAKFTDISSGKSAVDYVTQNYVLPDALNEAPGAGRSAASMAWANASGFSGQLSAEDFKLALSAFESFGEGRIFSNPKVIVSNGKEANVDMTTKFPNVKLTSQRNNSDYGSYLDMSAQLEQIQGDKDKGLFAGSCFFEWGITLTVKPRISPDGLISVEIVPTISQLDYDASQDGSGFYSVQSDTSVGLFPIINMKRITTDFTMKDGSTAVIGGLSRTTESDVDSGIPYLRKIPWIGPKIFGWKSRQKVQKEIIVCVTIGIANPAELPKDIGLPKNAIMGREYIEGRRLEPGDHEGSALEALKLDMRNLDDRNKDDAPGSVTITPAS